MNIQGLLQNLSRRAKRLKRAFRSDIEARERCDGKLKVIAKIMAHLERMAPAQDRREVPWLCRGIRGGQLRAQLLVRLGLNAGLQPRAAEALKPIVGE